MNNTLHNIYDLPHTVQTLNCWNLDGCSMCIREEGENFIQCDDRQQKRVKRYWVNSISPDDVRNSRFEGSTKCEAKNKTTKRKVVVTPLACGMLYSFIVC